MQGLTENEVLTIRSEFGKNVLHINERRRLLRVLWDIISEPMFLLLAAACVLYFVLGERTEGFMMVLAICFVGAISVFQEIKSSNALEALQQLTEPKVQVIRDGHEAEIPIEDLVPGDIIILKEGEKIPADALIIEENDLSVNESVITGESFPAEKNVSDNNQIFQGSVINSGRCIARVTATGTRTILGKIGKSIITYVAGKTVLQRQVDVFVRWFAYFGIAAFFLIFSINYVQNKDIVVSLLFGLTLAMSAIPEEIPVAFSSFMALGAYYMSKLGIISRQPQTIENLGAVNIICLDKTGTITENEMKVDTVYDFTVEKKHDTNRMSGALFYGLLASEINPFDVMEKAIVTEYQKAHELLPGLKMIGEYALHGHPPMMTHVYEVNGEKVAAAKGALERIIRICKLSEKDKDKIVTIARTMALKGHRVLAVSSAVFMGETLPQEQDEFDWVFEGLISFYDPPKPYIKKIFKQFYDAGISIKLLTGDFPETALTIADETELRHDGSYVTGEQIMKANPEQLMEICKSSTIFARMHPEAKLKVINCLKEGGDIVAMTGDGVNDGPALRAANIGIALGQKGTEVARQSADLVITDDDLHKLVDAVRQGRKIFANIKKAIRYIISIHIPIILTASVPLLLGWRYPNIFTPIHVIFLELIMGPTCSVFFEREPVEDSVMKTAPRKKGGWFFTRSEFIISIIQGLVISCGVLVLYYIYMANGSSLQRVRTVVFSTIILSNIALTFANRSFSDSLVKTIHYKNSLALPVFILSLCFLIIIHIVPFARDHFGMRPLNLPDILFCLVTALGAVGWFEVYKAFFKKRNLPAGADQ